MIFALFNSPPGTQHQIARRISRGTNYRVATQCSATCGLKRPVTLRNIPLPSRAVAGEPSRKLGGRRFERSNLGAIVSVYSNLSTGTYLKHVAEMSVYNICPPSPQPLEIHV